MLTPSVAQPTSHSSLNIQPASVGTPFLRDSYIVGYIHRAAVVKHKSHLAEITDLSCDTSILVVDASDEAECSHLLRLLTQFDALRLALVVFDFALLIL
jgi:hypothetical protein